MIHLFGFFSKLFYIILYKKKKFYVRLVKSLKDFMKIHDGENIIVCGCGTSLEKLRNCHEEFITIGVNDVPAMFDPTYLLVTDHPGRFYGHRKELVQKSKAKHLFTCVKGWRHQSIVHFELGYRELRSLESNTKIDHFLNSPYVAVGLAYKMGAKNIGLIGVDFTNGHFYNSNDGSHPLIKANYLRRLNSSYQIMANELSKKGTSLYNLSEISKIEIPKISLEKFKEL
jgi:hypothetical protein